VKVRQTVLVMLPVLLAAGLMLPCTGRGLPYQLNIDEDQHILTARLIINRLDLSPMTERPNYPDFFALVLACVFAPFALVSVVLGKVFGYPGIEAYRNFANLMLLARITSAVLSMGSIILLYKLAKEVLDEGVAWIGAFLLAVAFPFVQYSVRGVNDACVTFLMLLSVYLANRYTRSGRARILVASAFVAGCAVATKYYVAPLGAVLLTALIIRWKAARSEAQFSLKGFFGAHLLLPGVAGLGGVFLGLPQMFLQPARFIEALRGDAEFFGTGSAALKILSPNYAADYIEQLWWAWPILAAAGLVLFLALGRRSPATWLVACFPVLFVAFMSNFRYKAPRYALPAMPFVCLFAAYAISMIVRVLPKRARTVSAVVLAAAVALPSAWSCAMLVRFSLRTSTRIEATRWIEANAPEGATIAIETYCPFLREADTEAIWLDRRYPRPAYRLLRTHLTPEGRTIHSIVDRIEKPDPVRRIVEAQPDYVITSSQYKDRFYHPYVVGLFPLKTQQRRDYYEWLDRYGELARQFTVGYRGKGNDCSPDINIYTVDWSQIGEDELSRIRALP